MTEHKFEIFKAFLKESDRELPEDCQRILWSIDHVNIKLKEIKALSIDNGTLKILQLCSERLTQVSDSLRNYLLTHQIPFKPSFKELMEKDNKRTYFTQK